MSASYSSVTQLHLYFYALLHNDDTVHYEIGIVDVKIAIGGNGHHDGQV